MQSRSRIFKFPAPYFRVDDTKSSLQLKNNPFEFPAPGILNEKADSKIRPTLDQLKSNQFKFPAKKPY